MSLLDKIRTLEALLTEKKEVVFSVVDWSNQDSVFAHQKVLLHSESAPHSVIVCVLEFNYGDSQHEVYEQSKGQGRL